MAAFSLSAIFMQFGVYQASQIGARKYNQDRVGFAYTNDALLMVLADGMGGHLHGEVAAQIAVLSFMQSFSQVAHSRIADPQAFLQEVMKHGHHEILRYAREQALGGNPGTTCVAALIQDGLVTLAHAGDSRGYLLQHRVLTHMTHDHSVVQQWLDLGIIDAEEAQGHPDRNKITNCLGGMEDGFFVELGTPQALEDGAVVLLCSDGLWAPLTDAELQQGLATAGLATAVDGLMNTAIKRAGSRADNTTAIVMRWGNQEQEHLTELAQCVILEDRVSGSRGTLC